MTASKTVPEAPKIAPRRPKRVPRGLQDGPRGAQDCPRGPQDGPRRPQDGPQKGPRRVPDLTFPAFLPKRPPGGPKKAPQRPPRGPKRPPKRPQGASKRPPGSPKRLPRAPLPRRPEALLAIPKLQRGEATNGLLTRSWAVFELKVPTARPNSLGFPRDPLETTYQGTYPTLYTH